MLENRDKDDTQDHCTTKKVRHVRLYDNASPQVLHNQEQSIDASCTPTKLRDILTPSW